jgi:hypothetical protein
MNVSEITTERLKFWANSIAHNGDSDTIEKIAMAGELLARRGNGTASAEQVLDAASIAANISKTLLPNESLVDWTKRMTGYKAELDRRGKVEKPAEKAEAVKSLIKLNEDSELHGTQAYTVINTLVDSVDQLQRKHDALENSLGLIRGVIMKMGDALTSRLEAVESRQNKGER